MLIQPGIEVEACGNAKAFERGPQNRNVRLRRPDDDSDFAERPPRGRLFENPARDLFHFALNARRTYQRNPRPYRRPLGLLGLRQYDIRMTIERLQNAHFRIRQYVKTIQPDRSDASSTFCFDTLCRPFQPLRAKPKATPGEFAIYFCVRRQERRSERRIRY